jgi:hypothetical protein
MNARIFRVALAAIVIVFCQATWVLAGTTGGLSGYVTATDGTPIVGAKVSATSPSASETTTTDTSGHFSFVSLTPDTYTVTATANGYETTVQPGVTVTSDNVATVQVRAAKAVSTLGRVAVTATASRLVRPGTTVDVYSINQTTAAKISGLAGAGGLDNAYSQLASIPGVVAGIGLGWDNATLSIRGGTFADTAYEFDGVPVNRSFDNYPATELATLGQQELQVYTGGAPVGTSANGIAGFVNQVIRNGSYPGFGQADLGIGTPTLYNKISLQVGGATPDRNFSYFVGVSKSVTTQRLIDSSNGSSYTYAAGNTGFLDLQGPGAGGCNPLTNPNYSNYTICYPGGFGPGGYILMPFQWDSPYKSDDSQSVINLHFAVPHHNDAGKDDIQALYDVSYQPTYFFNSIADMLPSIQQDCADGGPFFDSFSCTAPYITAPSGLIYHGKTGVPLCTGAACSTTNPSSQIIPYAFPDCSNPCIPSLTQDDGQQVGQGIVKLQYQHNFSSNAYFRIYGYSFYSWWYNHGEVGTASPFSLNQIPDYDLFTHTRGLSATFADQLNDKNLLSVDASVVHAVSTRYNNTTFDTNVNNTLGLLVNAASPNSGLCYNAENTATPVSCEAGGGASNITFGEAQQAGTTPLPAAPAGFEYLTVEDGNHGFLNQVVPTFTSFDVNDDLQASDRLKFSLGLRFDDYRFQGANTQGGARTFWFNAWNTEECVSTAPGSSPVSKAALGISDPTQPCPAGMKPATLTNAPSNNTYSETEPRVGFTYATSGDNVIRGEYAVSAEPGNAAFQQYDTAQQNLPAAIASSFYQYGFTTPGHYIPPQVAYNADVSWEHRFNGTDMSFKLTPYVRKTKDQNQEIVLSFLTNFASGLAIGNSTDTGIEFQLQKGDFNQNGLSGFITYTHENNVTRYSSLPNGNGSLLSSINNAIKQYNAYTSHCASGPSRLCGSTFFGAAAAACYTSGGTPDPTCAAGDYANPYWNAPLRPLFDLYGTYPTEQLNGFFPNANLFGAIPAATIPNLVTAVLNFRSNKLDITPAIQFTEGNSYGVPLVVAGVAPDVAVGANCAPLAGSISGDPRYPYGAPGGGPMDATCFGASIAIPDPVSGNFDSFGTYRNPSNINVGMQLSYDITPRTTAQVQLLNLYDSCFGGASEPWTQGASHKICGYVGGGNGFGFGGNFYNPNSVIQPGERFPYVQSPGTAPFTAVFDLKFKL